MLKKQENELVAQYVKEEKKQVSAEVLKTEAVLKPFKKAVQKANKEARRAHAPMPPPST